MMLGPTTRMILLSVAIWTTPRVDSTRPVGDVDLKTTVALTPAAFWRLAHSEDFYRNTRLPSGTIRQRVLRVSRWASPDGNTINKDTEDNKDEGNDVDVTPPDWCESGPRGGGIQALFATATRRQLQREAVLAYDVSSPLGKSEASAVQSLALAMEDGVITYSEVTSVSGLPMISGDVVSGTTLAVTPSPSDPASVVVLISVSVGEVVLPFAARFLKGRIKKIMRKDLEKSATSYLEAMVKAGGGC